MISVPWRQYRLDLRAKRTLWSLIVMVWVVALGGVGFVATGRVADVSLSIVNTQAVPMMAVGKLKGIIWKIYLRGILHAGLNDPGEMDKLAKEVESLSVQLDAQRVAYEKSARLSKAWLAIFQKEWRVFQAVARQSQALSQNYAKEDAMQRLVVEGEKAFKTVLALLEDEENRYWQQMTLLRHHASLTRHDASQWIVGMTVLFGLVVLGGWFYVRSVTDSLGRVTHALVTAVSQMTVAVNEQERVASQQAVAVNETNTTMEVLGVSVRQTAEQADGAAHGAQSAQAFSQQGMVRVKETLRSMENAKKQVGSIAKQLSLLSEQMGQIQTITDVVSEFANETKMLAMNAAVEAVRAGEYGKGFSVLAVEIRKLADESKRSVGQIGTLVGNIHKATHTTVVAAEEGASVWRRGIAITQNTAKTFHTLDQTIGAASESAVQISMNLRQQSAAVKQVVVAMQSIHIGARESASGMAQVKSAIQTLDESAQTLRKMIG